MGVSGHFATESYTQRLDIVQNLYEFYQLFLADFLEPKCANTPGQNLSIPPEQNVSILFVKNIYIGKY